MAYDEGTGQLVLFGGNGPNGGPVGDTWTFNGSMWNDMSLFATPVARIGAAVAYDSATKQVVLFGGNGPFDYAPDTWTFNGSSWAHAAAGPPGRYDAAMAYDAATNQVVLYGEYGNTVLDDTWTFNGSNWTQQPSGSGPGELAEASMAYDPATSQLILFGGNGQRSDGTYGSLANTWSWDGSTWTELSPATSPPARDGASMAYDPATAQLVLFGGTSGGSNHALSDTWDWDGSSWTELSPATSPPARYQASLAYDGTDGELVLYGGMSENTTAQPSVFLGDTWTWDGSNWTEETLTNTPLGRADASMTYDAATGQIVLFGGDGPAGCEIERVCGPLGETWTLDGSTWSELGTASQTPAVSQSVLAYDSGTGQLVYYTDNSSDANFTWTYDGVTWDDHERLASMPPEFGASMAYDPSSGQLILFGGFANGYLNDTWDWNGDSWTELSPPVSPTPRQGASMAYDAALGEIVLFGGYGGGGEVYDDDTWSWNGSTWTELSPATSPPARYLASMDYDAGSGQLVLFGGTDGSDFDDTWTFDGSAWTEQSPATSPPGRSDASMAYDPALGETILFGGSELNGTTTILGDTWSWDGSDWSQLSPTLSPPAREDASMTYDDGIGQLVLLGGSNDVTGFVDFWGFGPSVAATGLTLLEGKTTLGAKPALGTEAALLSAGNINVTYGGEESALFTVTLTGANGRPAPSGKLAVENIVGSFPIRICTINALTTSGLRSTGSCRPGATAFRAGTDYVLAVTGDYSGNSSYHGAAARLAGSFKVAMATSTTSLELSSPTLVHGHEQSDKFSVGVKAEYSGVPAGSVVVRAGTRTLCTVRLSHGGGSCSTWKSALAAGTYSVTASYSGSANFIASTSRGSKLVVS